MGGKFHLKLNIDMRPIANKYREGKMQSTLKRELKVRETTKRETIKVILVCRLGESGYHPVKKDGGCTLSSRLLNSFQRG